MDVPAIVDVDMYDSRLRVTVKDAKKVGTEEQWKAEGAMGAVMKGQDVQKQSTDLKRRIESDIKALRLLIRVEIILKHF